MAAHTRARTIWKEDTSRATLLLGEELRTQQYAPSLEGGDNMVSQTLVNKWKFENAYKLEGGQSVCGQTLVNGRRHEKTHFLEVSPWRISQ